MTLYYLLISTAFADPVEVGGYLRVSTRPDLQGGNGTLGYWNLYGRLLNERSYATLDSRIQLLNDSKNDWEPWANLYLRTEGNSIKNTDANNGSLSQFRLSQAYVLTGNVLIENVLWQIGTLESYFGDLGLYDMRPAMIFNDTVGVSGRHRTQYTEWLFGVGDAGYAKYGDEYNSVLTAGSTFRIRPIETLEIGFGGQYYYERGIPGNRHAPYHTPNVNYEDYLRGEVVQEFMRDNPYDSLEFPNPVLNHNQSYKGIGYLGFGGFGPIIWNNLYVTFEKLHPEKYTIENYENQEYTIYTRNLTDERTVFMVGNELQSHIIPNYWDIAWGVLYGNHSDGDNNIAPTDFARSYASTVLRSQWYLTPELHLLAESSVAMEKSKNGNLYREHADSIFQNNDGLSNSRGFEYGDTDTRITWQGKGGLILNPTGQGIFTRPSLRLLYGVQYSNQNNAFGNAFVENINQYNDFGNIEQHWHHLLALETESWF